MNFETLAWKDYITMAAAILGAGLGIMNTWNSLNQRRVRLRVTPMHAVSVPSGQHGFGIEVINMSAFAVTVVDVGFSVGRRIGKAGRFSVIEPILIDGKPWPRRLEARDAVTAYLDPRELAGRGKKIRKAYARTSCDTLVLGDSGALKQLRRALNHDRHRLPLAGIATSGPGRHRRRAVDRRLQPVHVATWIEAGMRELGAPSVKQSLAAIPHLFECRSARPAQCAGPAILSRRGKTPVLDPAEARALLDSLDTTSVSGLRDRALIGLMVYSFARIGAALGMTVEDAYTQNRRLWVRLRQKGGKRHAMSCHHNLEKYLGAYVDGAELRGDPKGPLFRTIGRGAMR